MEGLESIKRLTGFNIMGLLSLLSLDALVQIFPFVAPGNAWIGLLHPPNSHSFRPMYFPHTVCHTVLGVNIRHSQNPSHSRTAQKRKSVHKIHSLKSQLLLRHF